MKSGIKSCPFCGAIPNVITYTLKREIETRSCVICSNFHCFVMPSSKQYADEDKAVVAWNTRKKD